MGCHIFWNGKDFPIQNIKVHFWNALNIFGKNKIKRERKYHEKDEQIKVPFSEFQIGPLEPKDNPTRV